MIFTSLCFALVVIGYYWCFWVLLVAIGSIGFYRALFIDGIGLFAFTGSYWLYWFVLQACEKEIHVLFSLLGVLVLLI